MRPKTISLRAAISSSEQVPLGEGLDMSNGPVQLALVVAYDSTNPRQPPELITVPDEFYPLLGKIIIKWSTMEQEMVVLLASTMAANNTANPGWRRLPFKKRWEFLEQEWAKFADCEKELLVEMAAIARDVGNAKYIRNCIAHKRIAPGLDDKGAFLRFENENRAFPWTKRFYQTDLTVALLAAISAGGRLFRLTNLDKAQFFSSQSISLLQRLPDMGHLRLPMPKGRKFQPPP